MGQDPTDLTGICMNIPRMKNLALIITLLPTANTERTLAAPEIFGTAFG